MSTKYRYARVGNHLFRATEKTFNEYLTKVKDSSEEVVEFDSDTHGFTHLGQMVDFTEFSSAEAEAVLLGFSSEDANLATEAQQEIVED